MIGVSWNCRGLGNPRAVLVLKDLVRSRRPDFIFLIETLVHSNKMEEIKIAIGYDGVFCVDREGRSGGLALLWKNCISCSILGFSKNHIDACLVDTNNIIWRCTGFYGHPDRNN